MSQSTPKRSERVGQLLQRELGALVVAGVRDPRVGLVTVTEVRVTDDLKKAHVYVSVLGDEAARKNSLAGLSAAAGYLKHEATRRLQLRFAPELHFVYDDTLGRAQRLDTLLGAAERGEHETPETLVLPSPPVHLDRNPPPPEPPPRRPAGRKARSHGRTSKPTGTKRR